MENYIAQIKLAPEGGFSGFGPLGIVTGSADAILTFSNVISTIIGIMTVVAIIWFVIQIFLGALSILFSSGDKTKLQEARNRITTSLIGLVVVIAAIFLIELLGSIIGISLLNLQGLFSTLIQSQ